MAEKSPKNIEFHPDTIERFERAAKAIANLHCCEKHLHHYLAEFDFRHNNRTGLGVDDKDRATELAKGIVGKRLTYRRPNNKANAASN